ncbi:MAG: phosphoglucomutase/phosphomannomutase family protein [Dehalococcoidia bacterium]|nr:phosphoglucomutase/phosphomannomutase family protein [Dehalococcoidia bacterium]
MTALSAIRFGTDGWRALIARDFTFDNVRACADGVARLVEAEGGAERGVVVGYDTRFGSAEFAAEAAGTLATRGVRAHLCSSAAPTPVVSFNVPHRGAAGGIVITASHNPGAWNGFKYKPSYGGSAAPEVVAELERRIADALADGPADAMPPDEARAAGLLTDVDAAAPYLANAARSIDLDAIRGAGLRVAVDSMHGAGGGYFAALVGGGASAVAEFRAEPNSAFPGMAQPEPIAPNLGPVIDAVRGGGYDAALATDGDADRLGLIDEKGAFVTTLQTFALLCLHQLEVRGLRGPLVRSITQSAMIDKLAERYAVPVRVTPVGFKFLGPLMMAEDALAAGEESGGYAFRGNIPERDGLFSGLLLLEMMTRTGKRLSELTAWLTELTGEHHYDRLDVHLSPDAPRPSVQALADRAPASVAGLAVRERRTEDGLRLLLDGGYWGLIRVSGTEPLLRIYAEADSPERVTRIHEELRALAGV